MMLGPGPQCVNDNWFQILMLNSMTRHYNSVYITIQSPLYFTVCKFVFALLSVRTDRVKCEDYNEKERSCCISQLNEGSRSQDNNY